MSTFSKCPVCGRRIGLRPKGEGFIVRWHLYQGARCHGTGQIVQPASESAGKALVPVHPGERPSWDEAREIYEKTAVGRGGRRLAASTLEKYRPPLKRFAAFCRNADVESPAEVTADVLRAFHAEAVGSNPSAPAALAVAAVRSFMRWSLEFWSDSLPSAPSIARVCPTVAVEQTPHRTLPSEDYDRLASYLRTLIAEPLEGVADSSQMGALRDAAAVVLAVCAGLRRAEIARLRLCDVDTGASEQYWQLHVLGKGNKRRLAPLDRGAAAIVERYVEATLRKMDRSSTEALLLPCRVHGECSSMSPRLVYDAVLRFQKAAGITAPVSTHGLRSTFGLMFLKSSKGDLQALQRLFGHASPATTMRYAAHVTLERVAGHVPSIG